MGLSSGAHHVNCVKKREWIVVFCVVSVVPLLVKSG
jgi:hypothetical protein